MSVFVLTPDKFHAELNKVGFQPTDIKTKTHTIWRNSSGETLAVNHIELAFTPEYLSELLSVYGLRPSVIGTVVKKKSYNVTEDEPE